LVKEPLEWAMEIVANGQPMPPIGVVADLGHVALAAEPASPESRPLSALPSLPLNLLRTYEDHVLGKIYADWSYARASEALRRYQGRDRARGLAFLLNQMRERAQFPAVDLPLGVMKQALETSPSELLAQGWESVARDGSMPLLSNLYEALISAARRLAEVLGPEDIFELEQRTALDEFGQRLALRQGVRAAASLEGSLPRHPYRPAVHRHEVATRILDEDTYPVGGFTSLSNRGTVESLLHSQLAYIEPAEERPDLFDIKFLRDELLYYSRDENQFLRRRRTFVIVLSSDLVVTRFKDAELHYQRGILLLALIVVLIRKLAQWLTTDALQFHILFVAATGEGPLGNERGLLQTLLRDLIANQTVSLASVQPQRIADLCSEWARKSLCHCLNVAAKVAPLAARDVAVTHLQIAGPRPQLAAPEQELATLEADDAGESWQQALQGILRLWV
jgi:hypothetical protein